MGQRTKEKGKILFVKEREEVDGKRKYDGRVFFVGNRAQGLKVAQLK